MSKRLCFGFAVLEISYWCFHASFIGFASAYLLHRGISNTILSLLVAIFLFCAFLGSFFWGGLCDKFQTNRKIYMIGMICNGLLMYMIFFFGGNTALIAVAYPLLGFVSQPLSTNMDAWILASCNHDQSIYGKIRSTPSFFYAFVAAVLGQLIGAYGYHLMLIGGTFFLVLGLMIAYVLPDIPASSIKKEKIKITKDDFICLFSNRTYRNLIVILFLIGLAIAPLNNLKIIILENVGGNVSDIGIDSFIGAMTQVPLLALAGKTHKIPQRIRYLLMSILPLCMLLLTFFAVSPVMIFAGSCLNNIAYGILLPTMRDVTERNVEYRLRNLGHSLAEAVYTSLSGMMSLLYAGAIVDHLGVHAMLSVCIVIMGIPVIMSCLHREKIILN